MKTKVIRARVEEEEYKELINLFKASNTKTFSSFLRKLIFSSIKKENNVFIETKELIEMNYQIFKIGNNLNQIAKKLNQGYNITKNDLHYIKENTDLLLNTQKELFNKLKDK